MRPTEVFTGISVNLDACRVLARMRDSVFCAAPCVSPGWEGKHVFFLMKESGEYVSFVHNDVERYQQELGGVVDPAYLRSILRDDPLVGIDPNDCMAVNDRLKEIPSPELTWRPHVDIPAAVIAQQQHPETQDEDGGPNEDRFSLEGAIPKPPFLEDEPGEEEEQESENTNEQEDQPSDAGDDETETHLARSTEQ